MRFIVMFVTAVCVLFLIKLRWPKKKNFYLFLFHLFFFFHFYFFIHFFINFWFFDDPGCSMLFYRQFPGTMPDLPIHVQAGGHEALIFIPPCVLSEPVHCLGPKHLSLYEEFVVTSLSPVKIVRIDQKLRHLP